MTDLLAILQGAVNVSDKRVTPHSGAVHFVGVLVHHTATKGPGLAVVQKGRPGLAGPLCNLNLTRAGLFHVVSDGLAWHAGAGSSRVLDDVKADKAPPRDAKDRGLKDDTTGNAWLIGIEVDNDGVGEAYPPVQIEALAKGCAALCRHFGWSANRVIHHREWTARKIDMSYRGDLRGAVTRLLGGADEEDEMTEEQRDYIIRAVVDQVTEKVMGEVVARIDQYVRPALERLEAGAGGGGASADAIADALAARLKD